MSHELNAVADGFFNLIHVLVVALDEADVMPLSTSAGLVRDWADCAEELPAETKRFLRDTAELWELGAQAPSRQRPRFTLIRGGKTEDSEDDDNSI